MLKLVSWSCTLKLLNTIYWCAIDWLGCVDSQPHFKLITFSNKMLESVSFSVNSISVTQSKRDITRDKKSFLLLCMKITSLFANDATHVSQAKEHKPRIIWHVKNTNIVLFSTKTHTTHSIKFMSSIINIRTILK